MRQPDLRRILLFVTAITLLALLCLDIGKTSLVQARDATPVAATQDQATAPPVPTPTPPPPPTPTEQPAPTATPGTSDATAVIPATAIPTVAPSPSPSPLSLPSPSPPLNPSPSPSPTPSPSPAAATPTASCGTDSTAMPVVQTGALTFGAARWHAGSYPALSARLTVTLSLPAGSGCLAPRWEITIGASTFTAAGGFVIPASAITVQGISDLSAPELADAGLPSGTPLTSSHVIVTGSAHTLTASQPTTIFSVDLTLEPPATAPPGTYAGTISVVCQAAP